VKLYRNPISSATALAFLSLALASCSTKGEGIVSGWLDPCAGPFPVPSPAHVAGTVDAYAGGLAPLPPGGGQLRPASTIVVAAATASSSQGFVIHLPAGQYVLFASDNGEFGGFASVTVTAGGHVRNVQLNPNC
jgi:hypothetical protein